MTGKNGILNRITALEENESDIDSDLYGFSQTVTAHGNNYDEFLTTPLKQGQKVYVKVENSYGRYTIAFTNTVPYTTRIQIPLNE
jgi:hypothetical protein